MNLETLIFDLDYLYQGLLLGITNNNEFQKTKVQLSIPKSAFTEMT